MTDYEARQAAKRENSEWSEAVLTEDGWESFLARHGTRPPEPEPEPEWSGVVVGEGCNTPPPPVAQVLRPKPEAPRAVSFSDFVRLAEEAGEQEWLIRGFVPKGGLTVLGGDPKSGKTLFALDLGFAVASGREFLDREVTPAAFLYVTEEGTQHEIAKRAARLLAHGEPERPALTLWREGVRFDDPSTWQLVRDELARLDQPALLVLDPLRDLLQGDENDSAAIAAVGRAIAALFRDFPDLTVVLIHHLSKRREGSGGFRLRGSSALWGKVDSTLLLAADSLPDDAVGEVALRGKLMTEPRNDARAVVHWEWDPVTGLFTATEAGNLADRAESFLVANGPATVAQLAEGVGATPHSMRTILGRNHARFVAAPGEPGRPSVWSLPGQGRNTPPPPVAAGVAPPSLDRNTPVAPPVPDAPSSPVGEDRNTPVALPLRPPEDGADAPVADLVPFAREIFGDELAEETWDPLRPRPGGADQSEPPSLSGDSATEEES